MSKVMGLSRSLFVRGLRLEAAIGVHDHELGRTQPLIIDARIGLTDLPIHGLKDTLNYELVGHLARARIAEGHIGLVETLAEDLTGALIAMPHVTWVEISIAKPEALSDAEAAGCVIRREA